MLSNKRRRDGRKSFRYSFKIPFDSPPDFRIPTTKCPEENFILRATLEDSNMQESRCTVENILEKAADGTSGLSSIQRISYQKWLSILREDLETKLDFIVRCELHEGSICIKNTRHLMAAIVDSRNRNQLFIRFQLSISKIIRGILLVVGI